MSLNVTIDDIDRQRYQAAKLWISVLEPILCVMGIIGNLLSLLALSRRQLKGPSYVFLRSLMVTDLCVLLVILTVDLLWHTQLTTFSFAFLYAHIEQPLIATLMCTSNFLTVALSIERCMAVCRPMRFSAASRAILQAKIFVGVVFVASLLVSAPYCLEYKVITREVRNQATNETNSTIYDLMPDLELITGAYKTWWSAYVWLQSGLSRIVPFLLLVGLNGTTFYAFRKKMKWRDSRSRQTTGQLNGSDKRRMKVTDTKNRRLMGLLVCTVAVFFVCTTPALIMLFINKDTERWRLTIAITNFVETVNFAANFYVYCLASKFFRNILVSAFFCKKDQQTGATLTAPQSGTHIQLVETKPNATCQSNCE